ncbi:MAG UNVERIFIED_CONTAM: AAA family ATPase [Planctomycetaceae bacterium]|jgi:predicted ATPase
MKIMITSITIENFKGIRDRVKLEFPPITLLFGANSAGKSTILHALHYAREVFERHNLDVDQTIAPVSLHAEWAQCDQKITSSGVEENERMIWQTSKK